MARALFTVILAMGNSYLDCQEKEDLPGYNTGRFILIACRC
jgi:hypothetical protein